MEECLVLLEFYYRNSYESLIKMEVFEFLNGIPCRTPYSWDKFEYRVLVGIEYIYEMEEKIKTIP